MDAIRVDGREASLDSNLLRVVAALRANLGSLQAAVDQLLGLARAAERVIPKPVAEALKKADLSAEQLLALVDKHAVVLSWLNRSLADLGARQYSWPLEGRANRKVAVPGVLAVSGTAGLTADIECDLDGEALDGAIRFDPQRDAFLRIGVTGKLEGTVSYRGLLGRVAAEGAFLARGSVTIDNWFRHRRDETVFEAVVADLESHQLPGAIVAEKLRARQLAGGPSRAFEADQFVHVGGNGRVSVSGQVQWQEGIARSINVAADALDLQQILAVKADVGLTASYSRCLEGDFDVIACVAPEGPPWIRVTLSKSRTSGRQVGIDLTAGVEIAGLDRVAQGVVDGLMSRVETIIGSIEKNVEKLSDLRQLVRAELEGRLESRLADATVVRQIQAWLKTVSPGTDVAQALAEVASNALLGFGEEELQDVQAHLAPVTKGILDLIRRYRNAVKKLEDGIERLARLRLAITFAWLEKVTETDDVTLQLEVDDSQAEGRALLRGMLLGEFDEPLARGRAGDPIVRVVGGRLGQRGTLERQESLTLNLLGLRLGPATLLAQEWECDVTTSGEINIGVRTTLESWHRGWSQVQTCSFLADTRLVGYVGGGNALVESSLASRLRLEFKEEKRPTLAELDALGRLMVDLGVLEAAPAIAKDLPTVTGGSHPFGTITLSAILELPQPSLDALLGTAEEGARRSFADALTRFFVEERFRKWDDSSEHVPLVAWRSVQGMRDFIVGAREPTGPLRFPDDTGASSVTYSANELKLLFFYGRLVEAFVKTFRALGGLRGAFTGLGADQARKLIVDAHRRLMSEAKPLVSVGIFGAERGVNQALFVTLMRLSQAHGPEERYAVVRQGGESRILLYA